MFYTTKAESGYYYPAADYEALEAELAAMREAENILAQKLSEADFELARLRAALKEITERHLWSDDEPNVGTMMGIAKAALEASDG